MLFSLISPESEELRSDINKLIWPCQTQDYFVLGTEFHQALAALPEAYALQEPHSNQHNKADREAAMRLALGLALPMLMLGLRYGVELNAAQQKKLDWKPPTNAGSNELTLLHWLTKDSLWQQENPPAPPVFALSFLQEPRAPSLKEQSKTQIKKTLILGRLEQPKARNALRQLSACPALCEEWKRQQHLYNIAKKRDIIYLSTEFLNLKTVRNFQLDGSAFPLVDKIFSALESAGFAPPQELTPRLKHLCASLISAALKKSWQDMAHIQKKMPLRRLGAGLCSGTPKHAGRVLGWWYQKNNKPVLRFAHGGDRATHKDTGWDLIELPFCDDYYVHGPLEQENISRRIKEGFYCQGWNTLPQIKIYPKTKGSLKHQKITATSVSNNLHADKIYKNKILYVAGLYGSDVIPLSPLFKTPDQLYINWQFWLIDTLQKLGYEVKLKTHPKGMIDQNAILVQTGCDIITGQFDPTQLKDYSCVLFDFPGSAWFDALAGRAPMVLCDIGPRPLDPNGLDVLQSRCVIARTFQNENNLIRMQKETLQTAIDQALALPAPAPDFTRRFFGPDAFLDI